MMEKKGQVSSVMIWTIIAILVLVIGFGIWAMYGKVGSSFKGLFFNFGNEEKEIGGQEGYVRYNLLNGEVRSYDGGWKKVTDQEPLRFYSLQRPLLEQELMMAFDSYYYGDDIRDERKKLLTMDNYVFIAEKITEKEEYVADISKTDHIVPKNTAVLEVWNVDENGDLISPTSTLIYVLLNGEVYITIDDSTNPLVFGRNEVEEIRKAGVSWRDSVFKAPIDFFGSRFCIQKEGDNYLIVDLTKPKQEKEICT